MLTLSESALVISMDDAAFSQDATVSLSGHSVYWFCLLKVRPDQFNH